MKKLKEYNHKVSSEICKPNGAWKQIPMEMSQDVEKAIDKIMNKYEGKLSTDSIFFIINACAYGRTTFAKAMSMKM